tara:strand:- start:4001 stop:4168 length:168 start_codon:yes stop_codon:yes gene_type:complete
MDAKKELPALDVAMNPRGQYFIALTGTQTPFDTDMSIYTEEKTARTALHTLKENW